MRALLCVVLGLVAARAHADSRLTPFLIGELDYRVHSAEVEGETGFALGRLRLGVDARPAPWFQALGTIEWAQEKPVVNDAFISLAPTDELHVRLGYMKTPLFASARDVSIEALPIPELSLPVRALWPGRDLGVELQWTPRALPLETWVRVGNGSRSPLGNDNPLPSLDARVDARLSQETWGLRVGVGGHAEDAFDRAGIGGRTTTGFLFYRPVPVSGWMYVSEAHAVFWLGRFHALAEGGVAWEHRSRDTDGNPQTPREILPTVRAQGGALEVSWLLRGSRREARDWPVGPPGAEGTWNGGAVELSGRVERLVTGLGAPDVTPGGASGAALALRWWATDFLGVGLSGHSLHYDSPPLEEPGHRDSWLVLARTTVSFH